MSDEETTALEARVAELEEAVAVLQHQVDSVLTANEVLQTRYGGLVDRIDRIAAPTES